MDISRKMLIKLEGNLTKKLEEIRTDVLDIFLEYITSKGLNRTGSIHSLHGVIGGKNNTFVDSVRMQFADPQDFIARWLKGLLDQYGHRLYEAKDGSYHKYLIIDLLRNPVFRAYTFMFLERNFYRNLIERTRFKPDENLWEIWFGERNLVWGLLITPVKRNDIWTNDVSEIRRANYKYWTIGHVMKTGLIDPTSDDVISFRNHRDMFIFYQSILKRVSNSLYEHYIFDAYIEYLKSSLDIDEEPFLIPELRYAGRVKDHKYRLDFTILNPHIEEFIGIELSPHSTHMSISGIKSKTQVQLNKELCDKWEKEMLKRNEYFLEYGINILTFTDEALKDMQKCFQIIRRYLSARDQTKISLTDQIERLLSL